MKNNKNWIWIVLIVVGLMYFTNNGLFKKTEVLGNFKVELPGWYEQPQSITDGKMSFQVKVINMEPNAASEYVEAGLYAIEDNPWLENYKKTTDTNVIVPNCVPTEKNVMTKLVYMDGYGVYPGEGEEYEIMTFEVAIPSNWGGKHYYLFTEAFRQCSSQGNPGITGSDIIDLGVIGNTCTVTDTKYSIKCFNGGIYYYDNCDNKKDLKESCDYSCVNGATSCKTVIGTECGDGACNGGETTITCPADCKPSGSKCGDGVCNSGETTTNCPSDCKTPDTTCEFYQDPKDCTKIAMWVWIVGGILLFFMFMTMMK